MTSPKRDLRSSLSDIDHLLSVLIEEVQELVIDRARRSNAKYRKFRITRSHFHFQAGDEVSCANVQPQPGQFVMVALQTGIEVAIYRSHRLELSNGIQVLGSTDSILGVVL